MPIVTHQDEKILGDLQIEIAKLLKEMSSKQKSISDLEVKLANAYTDYTRFLSFFVRKLRDLTKQLETLSREERSGISSNEVQKNKDWVNNVDEEIEKKEQYYDKLKDLAIQKKSLIQKRVEYANILIEMAKIRKKIVDVGMKIEEAKNKMIPVEKVANIEQRLKDLEREFERTKKELAKKEEQLIKEREEVNEMWNAFKDTISDMELA
ncbi:MAG: hypothetical protein ACTSVC_12385 [Promethearchaeota archaeon]